MLHGYIVNGAWDTVFVAAFSVVEALLLTGLVMFVTLICTWVLTIWLSTVLVIVALPHIIFCES